jgi:deoxycytidylate deaminase
LKVSFIYDDTLANYSAGCPCPYDKEAPVTCIEGISSTSKSLPPETAVPHIAGAWATRVQRIERNVTSLNQVTAPEQATACQMRFGGTTYSGSSTSGYHAEVDCLVQAHTDGRKLSTGTFVTLSNPTCLICATALFAVGITTVPAMADAKKEYANYRLPGFLFDDEQEHGFCHKLLGTDAWTAWKSHLSDATRARPDTRQFLVTQLTQILK